MQGFVDRLAVIASVGSTEVEPGTFVKAFDKAAAGKHRIVFVGHSLGCAPESTCTAMYGRAGLNAGTDIRADLAVKTHKMLCQMKRASVLAEGSKSKVDVCVVQGCCSNRGRHLGTHEVRPALYCR